MIFDAEFSVGSLNCLGISIGLDAQNFVIVFKFHTASEANASAALFQLLNQIYRDRKNQGRAFVAGDFNQSLQIA